MIVVPAKELIAETKRGTICDKLVCLADVLPTCLEFAGIKKPDGLKIDGISLFNQLSGKEKRKIFFGRTGENLYCVIEDNYKYLWDGMEDGELLFDLKNDPYEQCDLIREGCAEKIIERMRKHLVKHIEKNKSKGVKNGKLTAFANKNSLRENRIQSWPGFHSRKRTDEALH
jgi:arylsulfatase A-like enzyme